MRGRRWDRMVVDGAWRWARWSVDHGGDGGVVALEEAVDEGVQEGVAV